VSQPLLHDLRRHARGQQERRTRGCLRRQ
jgi:hypothetical protein